MIREILGPEISDVITALIEPCEELYLVGGVVRDYFLHNPSHDIDFVVKSGALKAAKTCADRLNGAYYALDAGRGTGRALIELHGERIILDFATLAAGDIQADLALRDFTINALAIDVHDPEKLIDPLNGREDLKEGVLRPCSAASFISDPIRTIRAVRFKQRLNLKMERSTEELIRIAAPGLTAISAERKRDELFAVFESRGIKQSCQLMQDFQVWDQVFPLLGRLDQLNDVPRHFHSLKGHTLAVLNYCQEFTAYITDRNYEMDSPFVRSGGEVLDDFRAELSDYLAHPIHPQRQYDGLLYLAVLYHDLSKTEIEAQEVNGKVGFPNHAEKSADLFAGTRAHWALSRDEFQFVDRIIRNHTLPADIQDTENGDSRRALHRFYQRAGSAGVLVAIFHLADILATYEEGLTDARWEKARKTCRALLGGWFRNYDQIVAPPPLLTGDELMREFNLKAGPQIGRLLAKIQEEQAAGTICDKRMAFDYAARWLNRKAE